MSASIVSLGNLSFAYRGSPACTLNELNLELTRGERLLVAGPSGSGKSTLLLMLAGLMPETIPGRLIGSLEVNTDQIGMVLQNPEAQMVAPSVRQEVAFGLENRGVPRM